MGKARRKKNSTTLPTGAADVDRLHSFLEDYCRERSEGSCLDPEDDRVCRRYHQRCLMHLLLWVAMIPAGLIGLALWSLGSLLLGLKIDRGHDYGTFFFVVFLVLPLATPFVLWSQRISWSVLPDRQLDSWSIQRFLITSYCCYNYEDDELLTAGQAWRLVLAEVLRSTGIAVGVVGALLGTFAIVSDNVNNNKKKSSHKHTKHHSNNNNDNDENVGAMYVCFIGLILVCICWYCAIKKLFPNPTDNGYEVQTQVEVVVDTEMVERSKGSTRKQRTTSKKGQKINKDVQQSAADETASCMVV